jgi:hypothetical protein
MLRRTLLLGVLAAAPTAALAAAKHGPAIGLDEARPILRRAMNAALGRGAKISVAIVGPDGALICFERMDEVDSDRVEGWARSAAKSIQARKDGCAIPLIRRGLCIGGIAIDGPEPEANAQILRGVLMSA